VAYFLCRQMPAVQLEVADSIFYSSQISPYIEVTLT
jgi:hypothetical protein